MDGCDFTTMTIFLNPLHIGVFIYQLIRYARVCSRYNDFLYRSRIHFLTSKLLKQGYSVEKLKTAFRKINKICYRVCLIIISNLGSKLNCDGCHICGAGDADPFRNT